MQLARCCSAGGGVRAYIFARAAAEARPVAAVVDQDRPADDDKCRDDEAGDDDPG